MDLLGRRVQRVLGRRGEIGERGHRPARVCPHARPHAAVRRSCTTARRGRRRPRTRSRRSRPRARYFAAADPRRARTEDGDRAPRSEPHEPTLPASGWRERALRVRSRSSCFSTTCGDQLEGLRRALGLRVAGLEGLAPVPDPAVLGQLVEVRARDREPHLRVRGDVLGHLRARAPRRGTAARRRGRAARARRRA